VKLRSVRHYSGHPLEARFVTDSMIAQENAADQARDAVAYPAVIQEMK
jgi:hypothetical protein